MGIDKLKK